MHPEAAHERQAILDVRCPMVRRVPTEADWRSEPWDLDIPYAYRHFAGKTFEEAVALFRQNAICYQEDVMFMPRACLAYYAGAYVAYLLSEESKGDSDGASCFFGLAEVRADDIRADRQLARDFERCLKHLAERQAFYDADVSIYGDFTDRARKALDKLGHERGRV